jgi:methylmalonyl-CoA/ethylmalonyl-CoA epimerase
MTMAGAAPTKVAQIALTVHDLQRAKAWYGKVLGLPHMFDAPPGLSFFQCGETRLMLAEPEGVEPGGNSILYYGVGDVAAACGAMRAAGAVFEEEPRLIARVEDRDIHLALCRDSEGNLVGLISG